MVNPGGQDVGPNPVAAKLVLAEDSLQSPADTLHALPLCPGADKTSDVADGHVLEERERSTRREQRGHRAQDVFDQINRKVVQRQTGNDQVVRFFAGDVLDRTVKDIPVIGGRLEQWVRPEAMPKLLDEAVVEFHQIEMILGAKPATICRVTAPVPGPTSRMRRGLEFPSATNLASARPRNRPLGSIAPVVWKFRRNSWKNSPTSECPRLWGL